MLLVVDHSDFVTVPLACVGAALCRPAADAFGLSTALLGFAAWTLIEYAVHRALHMRRFPRLRRFHMHHHQHPADATGGTLWSTLAILALLAAAIRFPAGAPAIDGLLAGYGWFIVLHHAEHHGWSLRGPIISTLAANHAVHHRAGSERKFGVSTGLLNRFFRTD